VEELMVEKRKIDKDEMPEKMEKEEIKVENIKQPLQHPILQPNLQMPLLHPGIPIQNHPLNPIIRQYGLVKFPQIPM